MKVLSREELKALMENSGKPAVSLYLPTHRTGDTGQDPIRLKNSLREAEERLVGYGLRAAAARKLLEPVQPMINNMYFWEHQGDGLAIFISPETFLYYQLPYSFAEMVTVADSFHVKPLLPLFNEDGLFYVLALSQNHGRLLQCTRYYSYDLTPESIPQSLAEALKYDIFEKQHQFHTTGTGPAIFHGQGISKDVDKVNILRYLQQVDRGLHELFRQERAPLVIAAVDYLIPLYRQASTYAHLLAEGIEGNPDRLTEEELRERAWQVVEPHFKRGQSEAMGRYREAIGKGTATNDVKQAVLASCDGRISTLFVATGVQQWGEFEPESREVRLYDKEKPGAQDLFDFIAVQTLVNAGEVYALEAGQMPEKTNLAAIFRY